MANILLYLSYIFYMANIRVYVVYISLYSE